MSNTNSPFGFKPSRKVPGSGMDFGMTTYLINGSSTNAVYRGDPLAWDTANAGYVTAATNTTSTLVGIAVGFQWQNSVQNTNPWQLYFPGSGVASGASVQVLAIDDPNAIFQAQCGATKLAQSDVGANINFVVGTGTTTNGISGYYLGTPSNTTNTLSFQVYSISGVPVSDTTSGYNIVEVTFNNQRFKNTTGA